MNCVFVIKMKNIVINMIRELEHERTLFHSSDSCFVKQCLLMFFLIWQIKVPELETGADFELKELRYFTSK